MGYDRELQHFSCIVKGFRHKCFLTYLTIWNFYSWTILHNETMTWTLLEKPIQRYVSNYVIIFYCYFKQSTFSITLHRQYLQEAACLNGQSIQLLIWCSVFDFHQPPTNFLVCCDQLVWIPPKAFASPFTIKTKMGGHKSLR